MDGALNYAAKVGLACAPGFMLTPASRAQSNKWIGIRAALGASRPAILRWVLKQGMILTIFGIAAGLVGALALTRLLRSLLFGIGPADIVTYGALALLLMVVALIACYVPASKSHESRSARRSSI